MDRKLDRIMESLNQTELKKHYNFFNKTYKNTLKQYNLILNYLNFDLYFFPHELDEMEGFFNEINSDCLIGISNLKQKIFEDKQAYNNFLDSYRTHCTKSFSINKYEHHKQLFKNFITQKEEMIDFFINKYHHLIDLTNKTKQFFLENQVIHEFSATYPKNTNANVIYAQTINTLYNELKNSTHYNIYINECVFDRANSVKKIKHAFVIVTNDELEKLKACNKLLNNPVNFPKWDIKTYKDITFENGKGYGIFKEFTEEA